MTNWEGFEIVCIELEDDSEYEDCRAIEEIGIHAPSLRKHEIDKAWASLKKRQYWYHIKIDGELVHPKPAKENGRKYIHVNQELTPDDPLLQLPRCKKYQRRKEFENL